MTKERWSFVGRPYYVLKSLLESEVVQYIHTCYNTASSFQYYYQSHSIFLYCVATHFAEISRAENTELLWFIHDILGSSYTVAVFRAAVRIWGNCTVVSSIATFYWSTAHCHKIKLVLLPWPALNQLAEYAGRPLF